MLTAANPVPYMLIFCDGVRTEILTAGRNGWVGGVKFKAMEFSIVGSFDPTGPAPAEPFTEFKQWAGGATGSADEITCTAHVDETDAEGRFVADFTVIAVPA